MSSKRDLVEAHSFNRRRLVTAFVSGAPGGREVEPVRYGRALVAGVVISGLVVAGAAVGGMIKPKLPDGWNQNGLVIAKESGARFIAQKGKLYPVINTTSARLLIADTEGKLKINTVSQDVLSDIPVSTTVGIAGAPDALPAPSTLVDKGWTACVNARGGLRVEVDSKADVTSQPTQALVVQSQGQGGQRFLVAAGKRYALNGRVGDNTLRTLGLPTNSFQAAGSWVNLLDPGPEIKPFRVPGQGRRIDTGIAGLDTVGTPIKQGGNNYLLVETGNKPGLLQLSDFAYAVYLSGTDLQPQQPKASDLATLPSPSNQLKGLEILDDWPQTVPTAYRQASPCLALDGSGDFRSSTLATVDPGSDRVPGDGNQSISVESGHGALVQETSGNVRSDQGGAVLVDSTGTRYSIPAASLGRLGYGGVDIPSVSQSWTVLFRDGPALDPREALKPAVGPS